MTPIRGLTAGKLVLELAARSRINGGRVQRLELNKLLAATYPRLVSSTKVTHSCPDRIHPQGRRAAAKSQQRYVFLGLAKSH